MTVYQGLNGFLQLDTQNPSSGKYYKISMPREHSMGNWSSKVAFFNQHDELIYHRADCLAHNLTLDSFHIVRWSTDGEAVVFFEYSRGEVYDLVLIDLEKHVCFRKEYVEESQVPIDSFQVSQVLADQSFRKAKLYKDSLPRKGWFRSNGEYL